MEMDYSNTLSVEDKMVVGAIRHARNYTYIYYPTVLIVNFVNISQQKERWQNARRDMTGA